MKKVAIITLHYAYNYGSVLQAFALRTCLESYGLQAAVIDYRMPYDYENYRLFRIGLYPKRPQALLADVLYFGKNLKRKRRFEAFQRSRLNLTRRVYTDWRQMRELNRDYDGFICGSDQIWNFDCTNGMDPAYFLAFADRDKAKIAYAPSIAQMTFDADVGEDLKRLLAGFQCLSVRERSTAGFIEAQTGRKVPDVVDPTLLLSEAEYRRIESPSPYKDYIFVYMLEENLDLIRYANGVAREKGLNLVYLSNISKKSQRLFSGGVNAFGASPESFLGYLDGAEYVITNSFHAAAFSILFRKQFVVFKTQKSYPRMLDLLSALELTDRIHAGGFDIDRPVDYDRAHWRLDGLRRASRQYLSAAIEEIPDAAALKTPLSDECRTD